MGVLSQEECWPRHCRLVDYFGLDLLLPFFKVVHLHDARLLLQFASSFFMRFLRLRSKHRSVFLPALTLAALPREPKCLVVPFVVDEGCWCPFGGHRIYRIHHFLFLIDVRGIEFIIVVMKPRIALLELARPL